MTHATHSRESRVSRWLRARAYGLLAARDGQHGWQRGRRAFYADRARTAEGLQAVVTERLRRVLRHAYDTSAHYRDAWRAIGFEPGATTQLSDLAALPFLTKDIVRNARDHVVSSNYRLRDLMLSYTGGTTGTQTSFFLDRACMLQRVGRQWGAMETCGYAPGTKRALVWGVHSDLDAGHALSLKQRLRRYAAADETLCCTVLNDAILRDYHARLVRFRPEVLYGYPSALGEFAAFVMAHDLEPVRVRSILTTAERLSDTNRAALRRAFGGEVFNLYCTREYGCVAHECTRHDGLHIDVGSVWVEIIKDGRPAAPGETGEITITDLCNYGMPFVRSRTGDLGSLATQPCPCGSPFPLLKSLDGRESDVIRRPDGSIVTAIMLLDLFLDLPQIRHAQFVQNRVDQLEVLVIVTPEYSPAIEQRALEEVRAMVGGSLTVTMRPVADLPRNPRSGKIREIVGLTTAQGPTDP
jgi:phenylacetate-CoA ligase